MCQVDVTEGKSSGDKRRVIGIELPFHPVWPYPVQVVLDSLGVNESPGMKNDPGSQELYGLLNLRGLGETSQTGEQGERVNDSVGLCSRFTRNLHGSHRRNMSQRI